MIRLSPGLRPWLAGIALAAGLLTGLAATPARAGWHSGVYVGFGLPPVVVAPPIFVPPRPVYYPPAYYYPPAVVYPAPAFYPPPPAGAGCDAGRYQCPLTRPVPVGAACSCPIGGGTRVTGIAR